MPTTISVSPAIPDKLVVNGVDLVNREELSASQNRELQRYIDANAHLLGFLDKNKEQQPTDGDEKRTPLTISVAEKKIGSLSPGQTSGGTSDKLRPFSSDGSSFSSPTYGRPPSAIATSFNRTGSPYSMGGGSEYGGGGGRRKGVSWSDVVEEPRPTRTQSNSPPPALFIRHSAPTLNNKSPLGNDSEFGTDKVPYGKGTWDDGSLLDGERDYIKHRHNSQNPFDRADGWGSSNPWTGSLDHRGGGSRDRERRGTPAGGFLKPDLPTYSALGRSPDDFNPFQTHLHREEAKGLRKSQEKDELIKFHSYGDHRVSGIEMKPKGWTGGEIVTDRYIMKKSIKPRRIYYSPIGDGVVAADGIEMKRPPPDMAPRRYEYYQRYVEHDPGKPGLRVSESVWHEGGPGDGGAERVERTPPTGWPSDDGLQQQRRGRPRDDDGKGRGGAGEGPKWPGLDDDGGRRKGRPKGEEEGPEGPGADERGPAKSAGLGKFPLLDYGEGKKPSQHKGDDDGTRGKAPSELSVGPGGVPREGWTKEFITNPRELINQYGTETLTTIFDYEDHTPKTYTTMREIWSPAPPNLPAEVEEVQ